VAATTDEQRKQRLVLWSTDLSIVIINRYPYTNGHLLIAPKSHKSEMEQLNSDEILDLQVQTIEGLKLLKRALSPQGFNIGINLGRCAGAGLPGHVHQHIVPRWGGDTNFMSVVGDVRIVPQAMSQLYDELVRAMSRS
jgi:ATP adenylyltransferase